MLQIFTVLILVLSYILPSSPWCGEAEEAYARKDWETAFELFLNRAKTGEEVAQFNIGLMYENGRGAKRDFAAAKKWYGKAAEQNNAEAQVNLGLLLLRNQPGANEYEEAKKWFQKAAEREHAGAKANLGAMYLLGLGGHRDPKKAFILTEEAAKQGNKEAQYNLGEMYEYGEGVVVDPSEALDWYEKAGRQGVESAKEAAERLIKGFWGAEDLKKRLKENEKYSGPINGLFDDTRAETMRAIRAAANLEVGDYDITALHNHLFYRVKDKLAARSPSTGPVALPPPPFVLFGDYHALVIGNQNYSYLSNLETSRKDAQKVSELLEDKYGFKVQTLYDATESEIKDAINQYRYSLNSNDNLLIYFAGHGWIDDATDRGYWLPIDATKQNPDKYVSTDDITNDLKAIPAKHVLVVADSCYSGTLTRDESIDIGRSRFEEETELARRLARDRSRTALTAGGLEPVMDSGAEGHSVFAFAFIRALSRNNKIISMQSLSHKIQTAVIKDAPHTPEYKTIRFAGSPNDGDFVFVPKGAAENSTFSKAP